MDAFMMDHLDKWLEKRFSWHMEKEMSETKVKILALVQEYPELLSDRSWPEIEMLATRN